MGYPEKAETLRELSEVNARKEEQTLGSKIVFFLRIKNDKDYVCIPFRRIFSEIRFSSQKFSCILCVLFLVPVVLYILVKPWGLDPLYREQNMLGN